MKYSIGKTAKMLGVSVRTLRYYDDIDLVKPAEVSESGYRFYSQNEISTLQQIMFYRELEFSLDEIKKILFSSDYNSMQALKKHRELLKLRKQHIESLIKLADETIGEKIMSKPEITAEEIENTKKQYANEVKQKWGSTKAYEESRQKYESQTDDERIQSAEEQNRIFKAFASHIGDDPSSADIQILVKRWQDYISKYHYECSNQILSCLGQMYITDERFKQNIDRYGEGTAQLMSDAISIYCR